MHKAFSGDRAWLSNMYRCTIRWRSVDFPAVENAYQSAKFLDEDLAAAFACLDPYAARRQGGPKGGLTEYMRTDWTDAVKLDVMGCLVFQKSQIPEIRELLLATGEEEIVEENSWGDTFWGTCNGRGKNHLGKIWMECRKWTRAPYRGPLGGGGCWTNK